MSCRYHTYIYNLLDLMKRMTDNGTIVSTYTYNLSEIMISLSSRDTDGKEPKISAVPEKGGEILLV